MLDEDLFHLLEDLEHVVNMTQAIQFNLARQWYLWLFRFVPCAVDRCVDCPHARAVLRKKLQNIDTVA
jgi:hypothetical protein